MGYYPFYIPDSYLQNVKYIPNESKSIKPTAPVCNKFIDNERLREHRLQENRRWNSSKYSTNQRGLYFDQYV